jgi:hypothetical protein
MNYDIELPFGKTILAITNHDEAVLKPAKTWHINGIDWEGYIELRFLPIYPDTNEPRWLLQHVELHRPGQWGDGTDNARRKLRDAAIVAVTDFVATHPDALVEGGKERLRNLARMEWEKAERLRRQALEAETAAARYMARSKDEDPNDDEVVHLNLAYLSLDNFERPPGTPVIINTHRVKASKEA